MRDQSPFFIGGGGIKKRNKERGIMDKGGRSCLEQNILRYTVLLMESLPSHSWGAKREVF